MKEPGTVEIRFELDAAASTKGSEGVVDENSVAYWQLFIYNRQGALLREIPDVRGTSFSIVVDGEEFSDVTLYAFANIPPESLSNGFRTESSLLSNIYGLDLIASSRLIPMCRKLKCDFSAPATVVITLERMVSKIRLHDLNVDLIGDFSTDTFIEGNTYLQNVVASMSLADYFSRTSDIAAEESRYPWFYHANWMYSDFDTSMYRGDRRESDEAGLLGGGRVFYTLPNFCRAVPGPDPDWADLCTKLVVESEYWYAYIGTWLEVFYPVEILDGQSGCLEPNNVYDVSITVNCPGYLDPWGPRETSDPEVSVSVHVRDWTNKLIEEQI